MNSHIVIDRKNVLHIDTSHLLTRLKKSKIQYLNKPRGEAYKLLIYLSKFTEKGDLILDIGTNYGSSALCLSSGEAIVHTFDIRLKMDLRRFDGLNIKFNGCHSDLISNFVIEKSCLIYLDIDHNGINEKRFLDRLIAMNWTGLLICDDIKLNPAMKAFWENINLPKHDLTGIGHYSGTGAVCFNTSLEII